MEATESPTPPGLRPLNLGRVAIGFPVVQAALSGYSDWAMRMIARRLGARYAACEVMLDQFLLQVRLRHRTRHFLYLTEDDHPVGGQLMGADPEQFAAGAERLVAAGFDVIDINFGCPVKKVLGRCRGGYHLSQPAVALEIIRRTRDTVPDSIPVTVKMRRGMDDSQESRDKFFRILDGAFDAGVAGVTLHGRTVQQRYVGPSRWAFLREVKQLYPNRVILGSGDLFTAADCLRMIEQTGVNGVTVARGAIGNPWIFSQALALRAANPCRLRRWLNSGKCCGTIFVWRKSSTAPTTAALSCGSSASSIQPGTPNRSRSVRLSFAYAIAWIGMRSWIGITPECQRLLNLIADRWIGLVRQTLLQSGAGVSSWKTPQRPGDGAPHQRLRIVQPVHQGGQSGR